MIIIKTYLTHTSTYIYVHILLCINLLVVSEKFNFSTLSNLRESLSLQIPYFPGTKNSQMPNTVHAYRITFKNQIVTGLFPHGILARFHPLHGYVDAAALHSYAELFSTKHEK